MNKITKTLTLLSLSILCLGISSIAEEITLTTYYPAPYGVYEALLTDTLGVGDNDGNDVLDSGDTPINPGEVWIAGNVGIGTMNPDSSRGSVGYLDVNDVFLRDTGGWASDAGVPEGVIVMWSGTIANIPSGWALCDGSSGTPDLRDRFIYGVSAGENPGAIGGATTHSHAVGSHTHSVDPPSTRSGFREGIGGFGLRSGPAVLMEHVHSVNIAPFPSDSAEGSTALQSNTPPYYKLAFIMKL